MYPSPKLEIAALQPSKHTLLLVAEKSSPRDILPYLGELPAHLKSHPATQGKKGAKLLVHGPASVLALGIGEVAKFTPQEAADWGEHAAHILNKEHITEVQVVLPKSVTQAAVIQTLVRGLMLGNYRFVELKKKEDQLPSRLERIWLSNKGPSALDKATQRRLEAIVQGTALARDLIELPPSAADPQGVVTRFKDAAKKLGLAIELEVWDEKRIRKEGMGLLAAVSQGSPTPPRLLIARIGKRAGGKKPALYFVGKGVTFDTGGVNLKTQSWTDLLWMKKDMSGAAAVLGTMLALAQLKPKSAIVGITPLTSNSIDAQSVLPGDVIRSHSGKTVEIQNTDAEGRLILADALSLAQQEGATHIIDVATLTGACMIALGGVHSGLFSNNGKFQETVRRASEAAGEPAWPLPMSPRYGAELQSAIADLSNMGKSREAGATIGAKFLENFVGDIPWCHLDIAGTADLSEPAAGSAQVKAAGRMVHTFVNLATEYSG